MLNIRKFNPTAKLLSNLIVIILSVIIADPLTILLVFSVSTLFGIAARAYNKKTMKALIPLACFALAMLWMNAAFARVVNAQIIGTWGPFHFTDKGLIVGISLFFRVLTIGTASVLFVSTTDADDLVLSLIKQCHLNPGIAYGILTAFRFFPLMESDIALIDAAHKIRCPKSGNWHSRPAAWYKRAIPLLAANIRRAERVSIAMEARGFEIGMRRTYHKTIYWQKKDTIFVLVTLLIMTVILLISAHMGWLVVFRRWQGFN